MNFYTRKNINPNAAINTAANAEDDETFDDAEPAFEGDFKGVGHENYGHGGCFCRQQCYNQPQCWQNQWNDFPCGSQCGSQWCPPPPQCWPPPPPQCKCPPGPRGPRGPRGRTGRTGPRGPRGEGSDGAIIPFASGNAPVALTTVLNDTLTLTTGYVSAIGFGETQNGITIGTGGELSLSAGNMAFSVPRNTTITAVTAYFTNTAQISINSSVVQISAQLYYSQTPNNVFLPLTGTRVNLTPTLTGVIPAGSVFTGTIDNLKVNVLQGTRLVLIFFARVISGTGIATTIGGNASAGVNVI